MRTRYGLKAIIHLAKQYGRGPVLIAELARSEAIPRKFLEVILLELRNDGVLESRKGKGGGYGLARPPAAITLGTVIRLLNGPLAPVPCASQTAHARCNGCEDESACGIRSVMKEVRDAMAKILDGTTLADILARMTGSEQLMYSI